MTITYRTTRFISFRRDHSWLCYRFQTPSDKRLQFFFRRYSAITVLWIFLQGGDFFFRLRLFLLPQGCSSPIVVKFADTQKDKEQRRLQQQLAQQMQQLNSATTWGSLTGLGGLTPQYLAVRRAAAASSPTSAVTSSAPYCSPVANAAAVSAAEPENKNNNPPQK